MKALRLTFALLLLLVFSMPAWADLSTDHYNRGNALYAEKKFAEALTAYQAAVDAGADDPDLYLNLGNTAFRLNKLGLSIWSFEMGLRLAPRDSDLRYNLRYAQAFMRDELPPADQIFILRAARAIALSLTSTQTVLAAALGWLLIGLSVLLWGPWRNRRGIVIAIGVIGLSILLFFAPLAAWRVHDQFFVHKAIVTADEAQVRTAPQPDADVSFLVHGGMPLELIDVRDRFARVQIPTGLQGWIDYDAYRALLP